MTDLFKHLHAKLGCMVLRLFPKVMQTILKHYIKPPWLKQKYSKKGFRFLLTDKEIIIMDKLPVMDEFTIEICYKILKYEDIVDEPKCKWGNVPHDTEVEIADDIQRLINATNSIIKLNYEEVTEHYAEQVLEEIKLFVTRTDSHLEQDSLGSMYNSLCRSETDFTSILQDLTRVKAIEESLPNTENEKSEMFSRLSIPIVETFPKILRYVIRQKMSAQQMYQKCVPVLHTFSPEQRTIIKGLQFSNTYDSLDFTLIYQLLRQFPLITKPTNGWGKLPDKVDINLGDDVERIRCYRNNLAHRSDTKVDKKEFNEYFEEFCGIGFRMDQNLLQTTNYEKEIFDYRSCGMDTTMQKKYENAMKAIENIKLRFEKRPIKFYWGDDFDTWLTNLRSLLKDEKLEGRQKVRVQIIFQKADDVESNIEVLNSLTQEINDGLSGIEFIVATKGSVVLIVDILLEMLETDNKLLTTLALFLEKILARITIVTSETIDIVVLPVEESTQWKTPQFIGGQVCLEFDIEAQLLETDDKMEAQLIKISDVILKPSNGSGTNQDITATLLPIDLVQMNTRGLKKKRKSTTKTSSLEAATREEDTPPPMVTIVQDTVADIPSTSGAVMNPVVTNRQENTTTEESFTKAQTPVKYNLPVSVSLRQQLNIKKSDYEHLFISSCIKTGNTLVFTDYTNGQLIICNTDSIGTRYIPMSSKPYFITEIDSNTLAVSCSNDRTILIINISTRSVTRTINTSGDCWGISYNDNNLYVVINGNIINVMDLTGKVTRTIPAPSRGIFEITVDRDRLICIGRSSIYCCSLGGRLMWMFKKDDNTEDFRGVTTDNKGNIYATNTDGNTVVVIYDNGQHQGKVLTGSDGINGPHGIFCDKKENILLVCNHDYGSVFLFDVKDKKKINIALKQ